MGKTYGFKLEFEGAANTVAKLTHVEKGLAGIKKEMQELKKNGSLDTNVDEFNKLRQAQIKLQHEGTKLRKEIREQQKAWDAAKYPKDSLIGLRMEYRNLSKQIDALDAQTRNSTHGQNLIKQAAAIDAQIKQTEYSIGNFRRNVGNYQDAMRGIGGLVGGQLGIAGVGMGGGAGLLSMINPYVAAAGGLIKIIADVKKVATEYEAAFTTLKAVSQATEDDLKRLDEQAKDLGATTLFTSAEVAGLQTELAKLGFTVKEITASTPEVITFSTALGIDAARAAALAGAALRGFQMDATEMDRVVSVLGVSTTKSALDFSKLETQIPIVSSVAKAYNFTIEDTVALLGLLANAGFDASSAGTATRNILLNLADANGDLAQRLGGSVKSFDDLIEALKRLDKEGVDLAEALELTDKRSVAAFLNIAKQADKVDELRESVTDAKEELDKMAKAQEETNEGAAKKFRSAYEGLINSIDDGNGIISKATKSWYGFWEAQFKGLKMMNQGTLSFGEAISMNASDLNKFMKEREKQIKEYKKQSDEFFSYRDQELSNAESQPPLFQKIFLDSQSNSGSEKAIINPLVRLKKELKELKEQLDDEDLSGKEIGRLNQRIEDTQNKINKLLGKSTKGVKKAARELVEGSLEYLENEVKVAEQALKSIDLADSEGVAKIQSALEIAKKQLEDAKQSLRAAKDIALEQELEQIDRVKNAAIVAAVTSGVEREEVVRRLGHIEDQVAIDILETQIRYAKEGSKEREALEVQLAKKRFELNNKSEQETNNALKKRIQSELDEVSKALATDLTSITDQYIAEFERLDDAINNAVGIDAYNALIEEKKRLERQLNDEVKEMTLRSEREKLQIKLQYAEKGSLEYLELMKRQSDIDLELMIITEKSKDELRQHYFDKEVERAERLRELYMEALDFARDATTSITNIRQTQIDNETRSQLDALAKETDARIEAADGNSELIKRIRKEEDQQRETIEREAFERTKRLSIAEAKIQAGIAAIRAMVTPGGTAGLLLLPFIAGQLALSIAEINAQQFADGGKVKRINTEQLNGSIKKLTPGVIKATANYPTTPEGDNVLALVKSGETIVNQQQLMRLGGPAAFAAAGVPGFANGGIVHALNSRKFAKTFNNGGLVTPMKYNPSIMPDAMIDRTPPPQSSISFDKASIEYMAKIIAETVSQRLSESIYLPVKEGARQGSFEGLNDDKRLKERENSSRLNSQL